MEVPATPSAAPGVTALPAESVIVVVIVPPPLPLFQQTEKMIRSPPALSGAAHAAAGLAEVPEESTGDDRAAPENSPSMEISEGPPLADVKTGAVSPAAQSGLYQTDVHCDEEPAVKAADHPGDMVLNGSVAEESLLISHATSKSPAVVGWPNAGERPLVSTGPSLTRATATAHRLPPAGAADQVPGCCCPAAPAIPISVRCAAVISAAPSGSAPARCNPRYSDTIAA